MISLVTGLYKKRSAVAALEMAICLPVFLAATLVLINLGFIGYNSYAMQISSMNSAQAISESITQSLLSGQDIQNSCPTANTINTIFTKYSSLSHSVFYGNISYNVSFGGPSVVCGANNGSDIGDGQISTVTVTESIQPQIFGSGLIGKFPPITASYTSVVQNTQNY